MFPKDALCRAAHYPKFITPAGVFDEELLLKFDKAKDGATYAMSVASLFLCRTIEGVHRYGMHAADLKNSRFRRDKGREPEPLREQVHYVGFYEFFHGDLVSISMDYYTVRCFWLPEAGQDAHFQVEFSPKQMGGTKAELRDDRRAAIGILYSMLSGPTKFIAPEDEASRDELEAIDLPSSDRPGSVVA